eukprot:TRINITY_DN3981_c0_g1_i2.p1 TRINITY_DN3981_c0_g1~~TRINITY_DN3981_c0_g1_i2.p1  ORF type:complete len:173 (-),score=37.97 TRINITY_DN3981_c0_g1_i2:88-606(-)
MDQYEIMKKMLLYKMKLKIKTTSKAEFIGEVIYYDDQLLILRELNIERNTYNYYIINNKQIISLNMITTTNNTQDNNPEEEMKQLDLRQILYNESSMLKQNQQQINLKKEQVVKCLQELKQGNNIQADGQIVIIKTKGIFIAPPYIQDTCIIGDKGDQDLYQQICEKLNSMK